MKPRELTRLGLAIGRVLRDSEQTAEIHVAEELTGRRHFRRFIASLDEAGRRLQEERPELCSDQVDYGQLRQLPSGTLGAAYVRHLDDNGLSADYQAAATRYVQDDAVAYWMRRFRQTHDVWHALTGLGTSGHEEVVLHAFSWGQLRLPVSGMVVFFGTLKHIVGERRWRVLRHGLAKAYRSGRDASPLLSVHWERCWEHSLEEVRQRYSVEPCSV